MKKRKTIAAAVLTMALAAAMAVPAWASQVTVIQQIDEPLNTGSAKDDKAEETVPQAVSATPARQDTEASAYGTGDVPSTAATVSDPTAREDATDYTPAQETAELTKQQRSIILELVPDDLYRFYTSNLWDAVPETSVNIAALSSQDLVNELYGVLRNAGRTSVIFTPVEHEAVEGYSIWFDKNDALEKIAGLYGRSITESAIAAYNNEWGSDMPDMVAIDGNAIAPLNPEGEGKVRPSIQSVSEDGEDIKVSLSFTATFDDSKNNGSGHATAVFTPYPESIAGYRLKSIELD